MQLSTVSIIPAMTDEMIERVRTVELRSKKHPQLDLPVQHFLHGGMYARTITIPAGVMITGAHIILQTILVVNGHALIHGGEEWFEIEGYNVLPASAHRKQIFIAFTDVDLTMLFPTDAKNVRDAEEQFTNEYHLLQNREAECQAQSLQP